MGVIRKAYLGRFLKNHLLPLFGEEWSVYENTTILRLNGTLLQGVCLNRSAYGEKFVPHYFLIVLAAPTDSLSLTMGSRIRKPGSGILWWRLGADWWMEWDQDHTALALQIYTSVREQSKLDIHKPLDFDAAADYIESLKGGHFRQFWSLGVIRGLKGRHEEAVRLLGRAADDLRQSIKPAPVSRWKKPDIKKKEDDPLKEARKWVNKYLSEIDEALDHLAKGDFKKFCDKQTARSKAALKLIG